MNPFKKIFGREEKSTSKSKNQIDIVDTTEETTDEINLSKMKSDPMRRLHHDRMSDQERFNEATKYKTYQLNGLDIDF